MRLKSFYAKTTTEAMQMVRETLGEDAIIVATREEKGGKTVCITAAIERSDRADDDFDPRDPARDWVHGDMDDGDESPILEKLTDVMLRHSVPEEVTDQVLSCATVLGLQEAEVSLTAALEHLFSFRPLPQKGNGTAYMLVGPPGAGKTLAVAKLAARAVMNNKKVAVISTDTVRAGGIEQLSAFTRLMNVELKKASNPQQLKACLENAGHADQIFIDSGGLNPFDPEEMRNLARLIAAGDIEPVLAMPAGIDAEESGEIARVYGTLGVNSMVPTRIDIARRLGGLLSAAHYGGLIFAEASNTPKVADGLIGLSPRRLTALLMPEAVKKTTGRTQAGAGRKQTVNAG